VCNLKRYTREDWYEKWPARKAEALREATREASHHACRRTTGHSPWSLEDEVAALACGLLTKQRKTFKCPENSLKAMVKQEPNPLRKTPAKPRLIHFYDDLSSQATHGPEHYNLQKAMGEVMDIEGFPITEFARVTFASSLSPIEKGRWYKEATEWAGPDGRGVEVDGACWDATMGAHCLKAQLVFMERARASAEMIYSVRVTEHCHATMRRPGEEPLKWRLRFTTKSGHNDTTWRNSLYNALISALAFSALKVPVRIMVVGDDMIAFTRGQFDADALRTELTRFGITPEMAVFAPHQFCRMEFASSCFVPVTLRPSGEKTFVAVPKVGRMFERLFWTHTDVRRSRTKSFASSVVMGMRWALWDNPAVHRFLHANFTEGVRLIDTARWFPRDVERLEYGPEYQAWFIDRYGFPISSLNSFFELCEAHAGEVGVVVDQFARCVVDFDYAGPEERVLDSFPLSGVPEPFASGPVPTPLS